MMGTEVVARNYIQSVAKTTSQTKLFVLITIRLRFRSSRRVMRRARRGRPGLILTAHRGDTKHDRTLNISLFHR